ncbi:GDNF-inducible zinc finger protein 1-like [Physella acuta]|uniref:GDNF-inducible zinc finger protein 1-like n=1 Tax=Physella acuta TaxID=109671 RepID=UPI0027DAE014|nr:GDNF-inducible zinc finger protein 1-like [Physella acuta]
MDAPPKEVAFVKLLKGYKRKLMEALYIQWQAGQHCDLFIHTLDKIVAVHCCVLSAFSSKIESLVTKQTSSLVDPNNCYAIEVTFSHVAIETLVTAIYTGVFQPAVADLQEIQTAAEWFNITEVLELLQNYFEANILAVPIKIESEDLELNAWDVSTLQDLPSTGQISYPMPTHGVNGRKQTNIDLNREVIIKIARLDDMYPEVFEKQGFVSVSKTKMSKTKQVQFKRKKSQTKEDLQTDDTSSENVKRKRGRPKKSKVVDSENNNQNKNNQEIISIAAEQPNLEQSQEKPDSHCEPDQAETVEAPSTKLITYRELKDGMVKCILCYEKFMSMDEYARHDHKSPSYKCHLCHCVFYRNFNLTKHFRTAHTNQPHLVCRFCGLRCSGETGLRRHTSAEHNEDRPFACEQSGCSFKSRKYDHLLKHKLIHSNTKLFKCAKCGQAFSQSAGLLSHQRACYRTQSYLCDLCGQSFNHASGLSVHRRAVHFKEKPYLCSKCSHTFSDHRNLRRHMRIHENSFPYSCPECSKKFRHSNSLKAHVASKHKHLKNFDISLITATTLQCNKLGGASYKRKLQRYDEMFDLELVLDESKRIEQFTCGSPSTLVDIENSSFSLESITDQRELSADASADEASAPAPKGDCMFSRNSPASQGQLPGHLTQPMTIVTAASPTPGISTAQTQVQANLLNSVMVLKERAAKTEAPSLKLLASGSPTRVVGSALNCHSQINTVGSALNSHSQTNMVGSALNSYSQTNRVGSALNGILQTKVVGSALNSHSPTKMIGSALNCMPQTKTGSSADIEGPPLRMTNAPQVADRSPLIAQWTEVIGIFSPSSC